MTTSSCAFWNRNSLFADDDGSVDFTKPSKSRTLALARLNLLAYPSCARQEEQSGDFTSCLYPDGTMNAIWKHSDSLYGENVTDSSTEVACQQSLHEACRDWLDRSGGARNRLSIPWETAEFEFGVEAYEYILEDTTVLVFRGTFGPGDHANMENLMMNFLLESSTERMKEAWVQDAGLKWDAELSRRFKTAPDAFYKLLIRTAENYVLGQDKPLKQEFAPKNASLAYELVTAVQGNTTLSDWITGFTEEGAVSTGYWEITKYIAEAAYQRAVAKRNHTLIITGHSQGGTRAQLASMYLHKQNGVKHPTITFAATGSACAAQLLFDTKANLLNDMNPFVVHDHMQEYVHPLDPWGNSMLGQDVGGGQTCFWGKKQEWQETAPDGAITDQAYHYCSLIYGYSAPVLIAAEAGMLVRDHANHELQHNFRQCRYFTHSIESILINLATDLLDNGTTFSGCAVDGIVAQNSIGQCPVGKIAAEEEAVALSLILSVLFSLCCPCICLCWLVKKQRNRREAFDGAIRVSTVNHDDEGLLAYGNDKETNYDFELPGVS